MHHKTLNVIYGIDDSYNNLLLRSEYVSVHQKLLRFLVTEIFKSISQINPEFMWSFFKVNFSFLRFSCIGKSYCLNKSINSVFQDKTKVKNLVNINSG